MRTPRSVHGASRLLVTLAIALAVASACKDTRRQQTTQSQLTVDQMRGIRFLSDTGHGADEKPVPGGKLRLEAADSLYTDSALADGKVIGRFISIDSAQLRGIGLEPGDTVYWTVTKSGDTWQSTYFSARTSKSRTRTCVASPNTAPAGLHTARLETNNLAKSATGTICPCGSYCCNTDELDY